jgi:hypothetical protein
MAAVRYDHNKVLARERKAKRGNQSPVWSPKITSDERASRWLAENFELCNSTDRIACLVCAKQHLPVRNPANTATRAKPSRLPNMQTSPAKDSSSYVESLFTIPDIKGQLPKLPYRASDSPEAAERKASKVDATPVSSTAPPRRKGLNERASPPPPHSPPCGPDEFRRCGRPNGAEFLRAQAIADRSKHHERTERSTHDERAQMLEQAKLLELVQAAIRSGHVVLVGAEDTWDNKCSSPGKQVRLLVDAPCKYFSSLKAAVALQKDALLACADCMPLSAAYSMCMLCLVVVEIVIVMYGYACLAAYLRSPSVTPL